MFYVYTYTYIFFGHLCLQAFSKVCWYTFDFVPKSMDPSVVGLLVGFIRMSFGNPGQRFKKNPHHWIFCRHSSFLFYAERRWRIPIAVRISVFTIVCRKRNSPSQTSNAVFSFPFVLETAFLLFFHLWTVQDAMISVFPVFSQHNAVPWVFLFFSFSFSLLQKASARHYLQSSRRMNYFMQTHLSRSASEKKKKKRLLKWGTDHGFNLFSCKSLFAKRQEDVRFALT